MSSITTRFRSITIATLAFASFGVPAFAQEQAPHQVESVKVTILSTMLADRGVGEWGFAALVEADGRRILFDTGARPDTVLHNAETLGIDLSDVEEVVLSHNHGDHTGGLINLRETLAAGNDRAISIAHVAPAIFWKRPSANAAWITMQDMKEAFEDAGGTFAIHSQADEIHPGIWLTGPVPRKHPEKNYGNPSRPDSPVRQVVSPSGPVEDNIPESMSMVINTAKGLVVISGCGHAGMINTLEYAQQIVEPSNIHAAIGGFHLLASSDEHLSWTAGKLVDLGLENFVGAHCTGIEPVYRLRELADLDRSSSVVGATGATFTLSDGINALALAH